MPPIWLFTDDIRLPDPRSAVASLPKGICGVVLRHDKAPDRLQLGEELSQICRMRRIVLVVAGDPKLAHHLRAGIHLRGGRKLRRIGTKKTALITCSCHDPIEATRAKRASADAIFISPLFATDSHPGAKPLGTLRWMALSLKFHRVRIALGGISAEKLRSIPRARCTGFGAIGYFGITPR